MECFSKFQHNEFQRFFLKTCNFFFNLTFIVIIKVFQPTRKSPLGFDKKLLDIFFPWIGLQQIAKNTQFYTNFHNFFQGFKVCHFLSSFSPRCQETFSRVL